MPLRHPLNTDLSLTSHGVWCKVTVYDSGEYGTVVLERLKSD